jgi:hypothetical protein
MWQINGMQLEIVQFDGSVQAAKGGLFLMNKEAYDKIKDHVVVRMEVSDDLEYCAIIYPQMHIVNIYKKEQWNKYGTPPKCPEETFYFPDCIATLRRNTYYATENNFIFSFIQHPQTKETCFIFNKTHGELAVFKPDGELLFSDKNEDKFISQLIWINKSFFALKVWYWHPFSAFLLYNVAEFMNGPGYTPKVRITDSNDDDFSFDFGEKFKRVISIKDNKILYHGFEFDPEDFDKNFKQIQFDTEHRRYLRDCEIYGNQQTSRFNDINWSATRLDDGCWSATIHIIHDEIIDKMAKGVIDDGYGRGMIRIEERGYTQFYNTQSYNYIPISDTDWVAYLAKPRTDCPSYIDYIEVKDDIENFLTQLGYDLENKAEETGEEIYKVKTY